MNVGVMVRIMMFPQDWQNEKNIFAQTALWSQLSCNHRNTKDCIFCHLFLSMSHINGRTLSLSCLLAITGS